MWLLRRAISAYDQIPDRFYVIKGMEFLLLKYPPAAMSKEKGLVFAGGVIEKLTCPFGFIFLSFPFRVSYQGFQ